MPWPTPLSEYPNLLLRIRYLEMDWTHPLLIHHSLACGSDKYHGTAFCIVGMGNFQELGRHQSSVDDCKTDQCPPSLIFRYHKRRRCQRLFGANLYRGRESGWRRMTRPMNFLTSTSWISLVHRAPLPWYLSSIYAWRIWSADWAALTTEIAPGVPHKAVIDALSQTHSARTLPKMSRGWP